MSDRNPCPNLETNREGCTCPNKGCPNHGFCCACVAQHRAGGNAPLCLRQPAK